MELKHLLKEIESTMTDRAKEFAWQESGENEITITWRQD